MQPHASSAPSRQCAAPPATASFSGRGADRPAVPLRRRRAGRPQAEPLGRRELMAGAIVVSALAGAAQPAPAAEPAAAAAVAPPSPVAYAPPPTELDASGVERLALQPGGWNTWRWRGHAVNWLAAGEAGPAVLLIHGFGASAYHYRYTVPALAKHCRVYAVDCLGFGWSDKPLLEYDGYTIWEEQLGAFLAEVVGADRPGSKAVLVGNSLGGYNALATAAAHPSLVRGVVLLNAAGRFDPAGADGGGAAAAAAAPAADAAAAAAAAAGAPPSLLEGLRASVGAALKRAVIGASFVFTKQPARIRQVLGQVYVDKTNIDDDLVASIALPARHPDAAEVFYRVITASGTPMNRLLARLPATPLLLLWGSRDPWCVPARATQIQGCYPAAERVDIESGHCPHDDTPHLVNGNLLDWVLRLPA
jgi:pimeloyl-ACP methyl ester carboxylesterase